MLKNILIPAIKQWIEDELNDWVDWVLYNGEHIPTSRKREIVPGGGRPFVIGKCIGIR